MHIKESLHTSNPKKKSLKIKRENNNKITRR